MNDIVIRTATSQDADLVATLSRQTFYDTFARHNTTEDMNKFMNEQFTHQKLMEEVGAPGNHFLLAYDNKDVVGYARLRDSANPVQLGNVRAIEIARIYAVQHQIGKGVGRALMEQCIQFAKDADYEVIWLGVWEKNQKAIDFYTRWGFEKMGEHDFVLGTDVQTDWLMKKVL